MRSAIAFILIFIIVCLEGLVWAEEGGEDKDWANINGIDVRSVRDFLKEYPDGIHAEEARLCLLLHQRMSDIKKTEKEPLFVIPFETLEKPWNDWGTSTDGAGILVVFAKESAGGAGLGIRMGGALGSTSVSFDEKGMINPPMAEGSIIGFDTDGLKAQLSGSDLGFSVVFEDTAQATLALRSLPGETLYFGVLHGIGLVYLYGTGAVYRPDGKVVHVFPEMAPDVPYDGDTDIGDLVPAIIKRTVIESLAQHDIFISDLRPLSLVKIENQGVIFIYHCIQKVKEDGSSERIILFASADNPEKKGSVVFQQSRMISYDSYLSTLKNGGVDLLREELKKVFPDVYTKD